MELLKVLKVTKQFGGVHAVSGCSFSVEKGKIIALIGPNGAGKTTLFNIVNGFIPADSGKVFLNGRDISHMNVWERSRAGMSRTFQLSRFFRNLSVYENLELALRVDDDQFWKMFFSKNKKNEFMQRVREMMAFVGLQKDPFVLVGDLSYGQQKLFDLARSLLNPHSLLLLDEPVAGINPVFRGKLKEILKELKNQGETILLIEHDMDFIRGIADHVVVMVEGEVLTEGAPDVILRNSEVLTAYLGKK